MKRRMRILSLCAAFLSAGILLQGVACLPTAFNVALAGFDFCSLLGPGCTLGPIAPCGDPTTAEDDLLFDCPAPTPP